MTCLVEVHEKIIASLDTIKGVFTCEAYAGQFNPDDMGRVSFKAPALFTACLGGPKGADRGTGELPIDARWLVFIVTRSTRGRSDRHNQALTLAEKVALTVQDNRWELGGAVSAPEKLEIKNLFSGKADGKGVALYAVSWQQTVNLGESVWDGEADGVVPDEIYIGLAPEIGKNHKDDYRLVEALPSEL